MKKRDHYSLHPLCSFLAMMVRAVIKRVYFLSIIILCGFLVGCVSSKYVERKQYLLAAPKNLVKKSIVGLSSCSVFVEQPSASSPFDRLDFLYRIGADSYLVDYYNGFLVLPAEQLDLLIKSYLQFYTGCDLEATQSLNTRNVLQVKLVELYADYREREKPQAVMAIQFRLTNTVDDKDMLLLDQVFRVTQPLKAKNSESLLNAWNEGLQKVMMQVTRILKQKLKR